MPFYAFARADKRTNMFIDFYTTNALHTAAMAKKKNRYVPGRLNSITACISTAMVLTLVGLIVFFIFLVSGIERQVKEEFTVDVLLEDSVTNTQTKELQSMLAEMPYTKEVKFISKEEATKNMAEDLDIDPKQFIGKSPFPAILVVTPKAEYMHPDSLERYMPSLKQVTGVTDVIYSEDLAENANDMIQQITLVLLIVALLLGAISVSLINNTMHLSIAQRRHTIQTMKLVGASWGFIRRPFLLQALALGGVASVIADVLLSIGFVLLLKWDPPSASLITPSVMAITLLSVIVCGTVLTVGSAFFAVNRHLAMSRDEAAVY